MKKGIALVLVLAVIISGVFISAPRTLANPAHTWQQTDWSGGPSTTDFPVFPANQTSWTKVYSKDAGITAGTELTLTPTLASTTQTTDTDFGAGTFARTMVSGTGTAAEVRLVDWLPQLNFSHRRPITISHTATGAVALCPCQDYLSVIDGIRWQG
ncbi:MAG: hypothetical protein AB1402_09385 [Bacillota bacterium]